MNFHDYPKTSREWDDMFERVGRRLKEEQASRLDLFVSIARKRGVNLPPDTELARLRAMVLEDSMQLVDAVWALVDPEEQTDYDAFRANFQAGQRAIAMQKLDDAGL